MGLAISTQVSTSSDVREVGLRRGQRLVGFGLQRKFLELGHERVNTFVDHDLHPFYATVDQASPAKGMRLQPATNAVTRQHPQAFAIAAKRDSIRLHATVNSRKTPKHIPKMTAQKLSVFGARAVREFSVWAIWTNGRSAVAVGVDRLPRSCYLAGRLGKP